MEQKDLKSKEVLAQERTDLAAERTVMATGRTLMAWIRTGLSLITFGFTIYKFLDYMQKLGQGLTLHPDGPRRIGLLLIGIGTVSLILGIADYWTSMKKINTEYKTNPWKASLITAFLIALLGLLLFISIVLRMEVF